MTLTAIRPSTGQRVCIVGMTNPREQIPNWQELVCPITGAEVVPVSRHTRTGSAVMAHFRKKTIAPWPSDVLEDCEYSRAESVEHVVGKMYIAKTAQSFEPQCTPERAVFEERIYIPRKNKYRIADVCFHTGELTIVHEIQLSKISIDELTERTEDYKDAGCDVQWHFGKAFAGREYDDWHRRMLGFDAGYIRFAG